MTLFQQKTKKPIDVFVRDLTVEAEACGFHIHNPHNMSMAQTFRQLGQEVDENFDLHMIQVCKPVKAAKSLQGNPERAALMPKFIIAFSRDDMTHVRFLTYAEETISQLLKDKSFPQSLSESYTEITNFIARACRKDTCGTT